jgi:hypothetical protein
MSQNTQVDANVWRPDSDPSSVETASLTVVWRYGILSVMKRTTIWLTDSQVKALAKISKKTGMKQAELIRRFIDRGIEKWH